MPWARIIIDGIFMSACFNLATGLVLALNPVALTTSYPKPIQKTASPNPTATRDKLLFFGLVVLPVLLLGVVSAHIAGINGFPALFLTAYTEWFIVNLGDFFGLDLILREKLGKRIELPGTEGHPCYTRKGWMKSLALPEHLLVWPLIVCPLFALISAGMGMLLRMP